MGAWPEDNRTVAAGELAAASGLRAWVEYLRDMGVYDLYMRPEPGLILTDELRARLTGTRSASAESVRTERVTNSSSARPVSAPAAAKVQTPPVVQPRAPEPALVAARPSPPSTPELAPTYFSMEAEAPQPLPPELAAPMPKPNPLESLAPPPTAPIPLAERAAALEQLRAEIGDCTRCPLAYAGRHAVVFGEGDPGARLMFVGEGPGADEDASGRPFIGKAGQLLGNMITAMGLRREQVFIGNIVKCRPPANRVPEFVEATTCSQFLLRQIDIVRPQVIVALGATAATYLLGVRQSLSSLRGQWFRCRDAKVVVTFHPAFLLRDPRQKAEAWKDLQRVMAELRLQPPRKA